MWFFLAYNTHAWMMFIHVLAWKSLPHKELLFFVGHY